MKNRSPLSTSGREGILRNGTAFLPLKKVNQKTAQIKETALYRDWALGRDPRGKKTEGVRRPSSQTSVKEDTQADAPERTPKKSLETRLRGMAKTSVQEDKVAGARETELQREMSRAEKQGSLESSLTATIICGRQGDMNKTTPRAHRARGPLQPRWRDLAEWAGRS